MRVQIGISVTHGRNPFTAMIDSSLAIKGHGSVPLSQIEYLRGSENYSFIHLVEGKPILVAYTLAKMAERLPGFIRIHKQSLVNPMHIIGHNITNSRDSMVLLSNDRTLAVSRRRASLIRKQLLK